MVMSFPTFPKDAYDFSSADVGQALAGLVARDGAGMPVEGMLAAPKVAAVPSSWKARVGRFVHVSHVSGAVRFSGVKADTDVDIAPATGIPAGQARIDRIAWDVSAEALTVLTGTAATSPVAPALGSLKPVARVRVDAGDGMVVDSKVTPEFSVTQVVSSADTGWISAGVGTAKYRRIGAEVRFSGGVTPGSNNQTLFTLPVGFRPAETFSFGAYRATMVPMRIEASGAVIYGGPGGDGAISLASVPSFIAVT